MDHSPFTGAPERASRPARPSAYSRAVKEAACRCLLTGYQRWYRAGSGQSSSNDADDLELLVRSAHDNGYEFARNIETHGCVSPDSELVNLLDDYVVLVSEACRAATKVWVAENGITVPFKVEDRVSHHLLGAGRVSDIRPDEAIVVFLPDAEAHRFAGMEAGCGYLVAAELLTAEPADKPSAALARAL